MRIRTHKNFLQLILGLGALLIGIMEYVLPELRRLGLSEGQVETIMVKNPRRALTFVAPR